jgi:hypothetical protein
MTIKTSLLEWYGVMQGGVAVFIAITIDDIKTIESIYWVHPNGSRTLHTSTEFLNLFNVEKIEDLVFYKDLLDDIDSILPSRDDIFNTFLFNSTSGIN